MVCECFKGHRDPAGAVGAELGLYGMRLEMSPLGGPLLITHGTRQTQILRCLKEGEDEKHLNPVRKKLIFHLKPVLLSTIPSLLCSAALLSIHLVPVDNSSDCLMGKFPPTCYLNIFFPYLDKWCCQQRLLLFRTGKPWWFIGNATGKNKITFFKKHDGIKGEERFLSPT